jgi:hypothetical protein
MAIGASPEGLVKAPGFRPERLALAAAGGIP